MNIDPREWELQERALREDAAYREVARALRRSPGDPPADFAASVAALAEAAPAPWRDGMLERWMLRVLAAVLGVSSVVALWFYGGDWVDGVAGAFDALVPVMGGPAAVNWVVAAGACMALSWVVARSTAAHGTPATR